MDTELQVACDPKNVARTVAIFMHVSSVVVVFDISEDPPRRVVEALTFKTMQRKQLSQRTHCIFQLFL